MFSSPEEVLYQKYKEQVIGMPELDQKQVQKRNVAYKVAVHDVLKGHFKKDESSMSFARINNLDMSRVNIIATLVDKNEELNFASGLIDDGTGRIQIRSFQDKSTIGKINIGDAVIVIGKLREFNDEKYLAPEIIKKIDDLGWFNVRKLELKTVIAKEDNVESQTVKTNELDSTGHNSDFFSLIRSLDKGEGAPVDEIIATSSNQDTEKILKQLLESGDIFELRPGRVKVLE